MMHPMRVEWTVPDHAKICAAQNAVNHDMERMSVRGSDRVPIGAAIPDLVVLMRALACAANAEERDRIWHSRYPDLSATVTHYGALLSVRYVPAQYAALLTPRGAMISKELTAARWVALVATADGTVEMDPTKLTVKWPMAAGDPIGGTIAHGAKP